MRPADVWLLLSPFMLIAAVCLLALVADLAVALVDWVRSLAPSRCR